MNSKNSSRKKSFSKKKLWMIYFFYFFFFKKTWICFENKTLYFLNEFFILLYILNKWIVVFYFFTLKRSFEILFSRKTPKVFETKNRKYTKIFEVFFLPSAFSQEILWNRQKTLFKKEQRDETINIWTFHKTHLFNIQSRTQTEIQNTKCLPQCCFCCSCCQYP